MEIAISGIGVVSAIGRGPDEVFASLCSPPEGERGEVCDSGGNLAGVHRVRWSNDELKVMLGLDTRAAISRTALLGMLAATDALADADAAIADAPIAADLRTGLVNATSTGGMDLSEGFYSELAASRNGKGGRLGDIVGHECGDSTDRIARHLGLTGFTATVSTACSSAANAIILGAGLIRQGIVERAIVGGTDALTRFTIAGFRALGILDPAPCRPFDAARAGLNLGEGAGYIVLQRADTIARKPYGYLTGWANAGDIHHQTASSPDGQGALRAMSRAIAAAGLAPGDIDYINAHGTGTPNNDASESAAFTRIWGSSVPPFGSTKPFTGHTLAAAGGIEAVISLLALGHGVIFPSPGFATPPATDSPTPVTSLRQGVRLSHVLSNSFGFGGNNSTLIFSAL